MRRRPPRGAVGPSIVSKRFRSAFPQCKALLRADVALERLRPLTNRALPGAPAGSGLRTASGRPRYSRSSRSAARLGAVARSGRPRRLAAHNRRTRVVVLDAALSRTRQSRAPRARKNAGRASDGRAVDIPSSLRTMPTPSSRRRKQRHEDALDHGSYERIWARASRPARLRAPASRCARRRSARGARRGSATPHEDSPKGRWRRDARRPSARRDRDRARRLTTSDQRDGSALGHQLTTRA